MAYFVDSSSEYNDMEALSSEEEIRPAVKQPTPKSSCLE